MSEIETEIISDTTKTTINCLQVEVLKKHFPQCFDKNGNFISEKINEIVSSSGTDFSNESYRLDWLGKSYARLLANEPPLTLLAEDKEHNAKPENTSSENLLIKGDNLEVLKHLKGAYSESIKMIYIDPPYNTGSDGFVYQDDRKFTPDQLSELAGIDPEEAKRILEFTQSNANSHSAWLTFMYPRLYVARELLKDDGVIFISIDDNEQAQLKVLCDEIFGEANFITTIVWQKIHTRKNSALYFSESHDFVLVYTKQKEKWTRNLIPREHTDAYRNPDNDPKGPWKLDPIYANNPYDADYTITKPNGIKLKRPAGQYWRFSEQTINKKIKHNEIVWGDNKSYPMIKRYLKDVQDGLVPTTWFTREFAGDNAMANKEVADLLKVKRAMSYPKPTRLIKRLCQIGTDSDSIVLDFFAGSGTTAQAVIELNLEDSGCRRFINIQLPE